ncbi:MMPL family transporter [Micromonospora sp. NPDC047738]|uniref:MMPL family transporter n=1 Tax=Micromonospora sp. NPDC047738 TaxID=3155741 RepID=UPI0033DDC0D5
MLPAARGKKDPAEDRRPQPVPERCDHAAQQFGHHQLRHGALSVLPLVPSVQTAVIIGVGVLLDTFLVRSLLVPALALHVGRRTWWPSALARPAHRPVAASPAGRVPAAF